MQDYKDLLVWKKAHQLVLLVYEISRLFPKEEQFGITSQLRRSVVSIPANIAEGCGKITQNDTAQFFQVSLGSLHETEYYILLVWELKYLREEVYLNLNQIIGEVKAMLIALTKKVRTKTHPKS